MSQPEADGPLQRYQALVDNDSLQSDAEQRRVAGLLQDIHEQLIRRGPRLLDRIRKRYPPITGMYLHGSVGRGKTMLMDLLAESLQAAEIPVWRIHFHRFMDGVHDRLHRLRDQRNPLTTVGRGIAERGRVLCFDEFHVSDIADAMILGGLLDQLFSRGVTLVTTSNTEPRNLYADGLQRERFVPAIEAIENHCRVVGLDSPEDYRLRELVRHPVYHHPADERAETELEEEFRGLAAGEQVSRDALKLRGRRVQPRQRAGSVIWFDFDTLCQGARASGDYIELARRFGTVVVSDIPQLTEADNNAVRRFVHLVDECYDRSVKLIISAAVPPEKLYTGKKLTEPFERTISRLIEMQSRDYLALPHRP